MHPDTPCIVMTTAGTEAEAESLAEAIVEARLAACVQVQRVRSFYIWQDTLHREPEWLLMAKTRSVRYGALEAFIRGDAQADVFSKVSEFAHAFHRPVAHEPGPVGKGESD